MKDQFEQIEIVDFKKKKPKPKPAQDQKKIQKQIEETKENNQKRYIRLLKRVTQTLNKNNPDLAGGNKIVLKPPQVNKIGKKKTAITNFTSLCKQLDRHPQHVMNFFLGDLGAQGSLGSIGFTIKNVLQPKQIQNLFRKYITQFVQCQICKRQNTNLVKDQKMRLWTLQCKNCKCSRTVPTIKGADKKYEDYELEEAKKQEKQSAQDTQENNNQRTQQNQTN